MLPLYLVPLPGVTLQQAEFGTMAVLAGNLYLEVLGVTCDHAPPAIGKPGTPKPSRYKNVLKSTTVAGQPEGVLPSVLSRGLRPPAGRA